MIKPKSNKFTEGEKVKAIGAAQYGHEVLTVTDCVHNGFTWMYSFEETHLRCGEQYLMRYEAKDPRI